MASPPWIYTDSPLTKTTERKISNGQYHPLSPKHQENSAQNSGTLGSSFYLNGRIDEAIKGTECLERAQSITKTAVRQLRTLMSSVTNSAGSERLVAWGIQKLISGLIHLKKGGTPNVEELNFSKPNMGEDPKVFKDEHAIWAEITSKDYNSTRPLYIREQLNLLVQCPSRRRSHQRQNEGAGYRLRP